MLGAERNSQRAGKIYLRLVQSRPILINIEARGDNFASRLANLRIPGRAHPVNEKQYHLVKVIQKMEVFRDFDATEVQRLLRVCRFKSFSDREKIYQKGKPSEEMLVLLKGKLLVLGTAGEELATISPGMSIGEMGLFTGQPRSASISAAADSTALLLRRADLGMALRSDKETLVKVLHNLVGILSTRLSDANSLSESQGRIIHDLEKKLAEFEPPAAGGDYEDGTEMELESVEK